MQEFIGNLLNQLLDLFKKHKNKKFLWIIFVLIITIFIFLIPYIDANIFYYNRIQKRIEILDSISKIDLRALDNHSVLKLEYESILIEINNQRENSLPTVISNVNSLIVIEKTSDVVQMQFFTGALISILVALLIPFMNTFNRLQEKILAFILVLLIGAVLGCFSAVLPVFGKPLINFIFIPILQVSLLILFSIKGSKSK